MDGRDLSDKCVRVVLSDGEELPEDLDCMALTAIKAKVESEEVVRDLHQSEIPESPQVKIKFTVFPDKTGTAHPPCYATDGAAGMDVCSIEDVQIAPGGVAIVDTGLVAEIPDGFELQVRPRSGLAAKYGITVLNAPGTIDSDYRGRIKVILVNHSQYGYSVLRGDRIAQLVLAPAPQAKIEWSYGYEEDQLELEMTTTRGSGGFGSTGA